MFLENIRLALHSLTANKMRTFLTMLGIMIGVGAVVAIETIGAGQTKQMEQQYAAGGVNNIICGGRGEQYSAVYVSEQLR